jgi:hypothetical protein
MVEYVEYPKALYAHGWGDLDACVTVHNAEEEAEARAQGYLSLAEPVAAPAVDDDTPAAPKRRGRPPVALPE